MSGIKASCKLNPVFQKEWREAIADLASIANKEDPESLHKLVEQSGGRFLKNVADITPPANGKLDSQAKARGEQAVLDDLLKLANPVTVAGSPRAAREVLATAEDLLAAHERARAGASGRVNPRNRKEKLFIGQADFNRVAKQLQGRVGWLAAGLNAAAERLGVRLPAWVKNLGTRFGSIDITASDSGMRIRIEQNVSYTDNVKDYGRRWDFALEKEIHSLQAQIKAIWEKKFGKARSRFK